MEGLRCAIFFATLVEPLSLNEAYLDVSDSVTPQHLPRRIGRELKPRVKAELHLTISMGLATTKHDQWAVRRRYLNVRAAELP